jgi:hypothetical protein
MRVNDVISHPSKILRFRFLFVLASRRHSVGTSLAQIPTSIKKGGLSTSSQYKSFREMYLAIFGYGKRTGFWYTFPRLNGSLVAIKPLTSSSGKKLAPILILSSTKPGLFFLIMTTTRKSVTFRIWYYLIP